jgi:hypothetical protein
VLSEYFAYSPNCSIADGEVGWCCSRQIAGSYAEVAPSEATIAEHRSIGMSLRSVFLLGGAALTSARLSRHLDIYFMLRKCDAILNVLASCVQTIFFFNSSRVVASRECGWHMR